MPTYKIEKILTKCNEYDFLIKSSFLPIAHHEFKPFEMVLTKIKRKVVIKNQACQFYALEEVNKQELLKITVSEFTEHVEHIKLGELNNKKMNS